MYLQSTFAYAGFGPPATGPAGGLFGFMFPPFELATGKHVLSG